jgi:hypothetical protein
MSEAIQGRQELIPNGWQGIQAFLEAEIGQIIAANLLAQESGKLFILLDEGIFKITPEDMMTMVDLFQCCGQLALKPFG